jgi:hypothetical protein
MPFCGILVIPRFLNSSIPAAPDDGKQVSAGTNHHRFDDTEHCRSRDSRIDRIAALLQNAKPGGRSQRLAGCDHSIHRPDGRTGPASGSWFIAGRLLLLLWKSVWDND